MAMQSLASRHQPHMHTHAQPSPAIPLWAQLTSITRTLLPCTRWTEGGEQGGILSTCGTRVLLANFRRRCRRPPRAWCTARCRQTTQLPQVQCSSCTAPTSSKARAMQGSGHSRQGSCAGQWPLTMAAGGRFFWNLARRVPTLPWARVTCKP